MRAPTRQRGVTLLELVVALGASMIVLTLVVASVKAQQEAFNGGQRVRDAQSSARTAMLHLERTLAMAGYGLDPVLAFDLSDPPEETRATSWYTGPGVVKDGLCPADASPCAKDRTDGSDELVFHARNPAYWADPEDATSVLGNAWPVPNKLNLTDPSKPKVTLTAKPGDLFPKGQMLLLVCNGGTGYRIGTVAETTGDTTGPGAQPFTKNADLEITLTEDVLENPFRRPSAGECDPDRAFLLDRYRFHVRPVRQAGRWESFLVLDRGLDLSGPDGVRDGAIDSFDEALVAPGIEVLQVSYEFTPNIDSAGDRTLAPVGAAPVGVPVVIRSTNDAPADATANVLTRTGFASGAVNDPTFYQRVTFSPYAFDPAPAGSLTPRMTNHQANVSAVHLALVARAQGAPAQGSRGTLVPGPGNTVLNLDRTPAWIAAGATGGYDGHDRIRLESTVYLPNMRSRRLLYQ